MSLSTLPATMSPENVTALGTSLISVSGSSFTAGANRMKTQTRQCPTWAFPGQPPVLEKTDTYIPQKVSSCRAREMAQRLVHILPSLSSQFDFQNSHDGREITLGSCPLIKHTYVGTQAYTHLYMQEGGIK